MGPLRAKIIHAGAPYIQDVVLTGLDRKEVGAILFGSPLCAALSGLGPDATLEQIMHSAPVQQHFQQVLNQLAQSSTGSATRIARAVASTRAPSLDLGEVTDKGSINQRAVLTHRADVVKGLQEQFALYADNFPIWAEQSNGMAQFAVWTALADAGVGASLQHYNPLVDEVVRKHWGVHGNWQLRAQMPFGSNEAPFPEKTFIDDDIRFKTVR